MPAGRLRRNRRYARIRTILQGDRSGLFPGGRGGVRGGHVSGSLIRDGGAVSRLPEPGFLPAHRKRGGGHHAEAGGQEGCDRQQRHRGELVRPVYRAGAEHQSGDRGAHRGERGGAQEPDAGIGRPAGHDAEHRDHQFRNRAVRRGGRHVPAHERLFQRGADALYPPDAE